MKWQIGFIAIVAFLSPQVSQAADVLWNNANSNSLFLDPGNWNPIPSTPLQNTLMDPSKLADSFTMNNFDVVTVAQTLTMAAGNISITVDAFTKLDVAGDSVGINGDFNVATSENILITGTLAEIDTRFVDGGVNVDIGPEGILTLRGNDLPIHDATISFASETSGQINATSKLPTDANFLSGFLSKIKVAGNRAVLDANISVVSDGNTGVIVTPLEATVFADVDRSTGSLTLTNEGAALDFSSYTIRSAAGTIDTTGYSPIANDGNDNWTVSEQLPTSLAEAEDPANNGINFGAEIGLGDIWRISPIEDLEIELNLVGGVTQGVVVRYSGLEPALGDFSGPGGVPDGQINALDWGVFRSNLFTEFDEGTLPVDAYFLGDLDNDLDNDEFDFVIFEQLYDSAHGSGAFQSMLAGVPEPSAIALMASVVVAAFVFRRVRLPSIIGAVVLMILVSCSSGRADIVWTGQGTSANSLFDNGNYDFSSSWITSILESKVGTANEPVMDNLLFHSGSVSGGGYMLDFGELRHGDGFTRVFDDFDLNSTGTNGGLGGIGMGSKTKITNGSNLNLQFLVGGSYRIDGTSSLVLRGSGDPINYGQPNTGAIEVVLEQGAKLTLSSVAEFAEQGNDIFAANADGTLVSYNSDNSILSFNGTTASAVNAIIAPLSIVVDRSTGNVTIHNDSTVNYDLDFYIITGSLDVSAWNSLHDQNLPGFAAGNGSGNGWEEAGGSDDSELGEVFLLGSSTFAATHAAISLGNIYDRFSLAQDLSFRFREAGSGEFVTGDVIYIGNPVLGLPGDFNADMIVDAADYTVWRDNLGGDASALSGNGTGAATVVPADYELWKANFGRSQSGTAATAAVPEPGNLTLLALAVVLCGLRSRRWD